MTQILLGKNSDNVTENSFSDIYAICHFRFLSPKQHHNKGAEARVEHDGLVPLQLQSKEEPHHYQEQVSAERVWLLYYFSLISWTKHLILIKRSPIIININHR